ncbi:MAG: aminoacyl-tRNA hydrolase [Patescibacteria group bacterium]
MKVFIIGLGNPLPEYSGTRHNAGQSAVEAFRIKNNFPAWKRDDKKEALVSLGEFEGKEVVLILPQTFMNDSGRAVRKFLKSSKEVENALIVHDELDLPIGSMKVVFDRGHAGHNGVLSVINFLGTQAFWRLRIGIVRGGGKGLLLKPLGEDEMNHFIVGRFSEAEATELSPVFDRAVNSIEMFILDRDPITSPQLL